MCNDNFILGPVRRRNIPRNESIRKNGLEYLKNKADRDYQIRTKELELEERKLSLEERSLTLKEKQFVLEEQERHQRLQLDKERWLFEKDNIKQLLASQQSLINSLSQRLKRYEDE